MKRTSASRGDTFKRSSLRRVCGEAVANISLLVENLALPRDGVEKVQIRLEPCRH